MMKPLPPYDPLRFPAALMQAIGLVEVLSLDATGIARVRFDGRPEFTHSGGTTVQGGILSAWLDCAMAWAVVARDETRGVASLDLQVRFISRVGTGPAVAQARIVKWGRNVAVLEADLFDEDGKLLVKASSSGILV